MCLSGCVSAVFAVQQRALWKATRVHDTGGFDAPQVLAFLDALEQQRHSSIRSRNARLAAIRSFLRYAALQDPAALGAISRTLAIPVKRFDRVLVPYLSREEMTTLLSAPDCSTWSGHRDAVLLATMYNTGARVSEAIKLNVEDVEFGPATTLRIHGKGRKERVVPCGRAPDGNFQTGFAGLALPSAVHCSRVAVANASPEPVFARVLTPLWLLLDGPV
jgi:site-specific recombinase XerD